MANIKNIKIVWDATVIPETVMPIDLACPSGSPVSLVAGFWDISVSPPVKHFVAVPSNPNIIEAVAILDCNTNMVEYLSTETMGYLQGLVVENCEACKKVTTGTCNCIITTEVALSGLHQTITAASQGMSSFSGHVILDPSRNEIISQVNYNAGRTEITIDANPVLNGCVIILTGYKI